jgi:ribonuclease HI
MSKNNISKKEKQYYYSVHKGYSKGIFYTWDECKKNVDGYLNPIYKKFDNIEDAEYFMENGYKNKSPSILAFLDIDEKKEGKKEEKKVIKIDTKDSDLLNPNYFQPEFTYIFCDGSSLHKNYKSIRCGYGLYIVNPNGESIKISEHVDNSGTNNVAELSAILHGLKLIDNKNIKKTIFISDSTYAINSITVWSKSWKKNNWLTSNKKPVENVEIIKEAVEKYEYLVSKGYHIIFKHIMSHKKQPEDVKSYDYFLWYGNEMTDQLAKYGDINKEYSEPLIYSI